MRQYALIDKLDQKLQKTDIPYFQVGDTLRIHLRIIEGNKERVQVFMGTVIARTGSGLSETVSLHRVAYGEGMERVFLLHSPRIQKIEIVKSGKVRRAKLYYLRGTQGKAAKVKSFFGKRKNAKEAENKNAEPVPTEEPKDKQETTNE